MPLSVPYIVLVAKQREIDELKRLKARAKLVSALGHMIHVLQSERGASSTFLASSGTRFEETRLQLAAESESVESELRRVIEVELVNPAFANARIISLMAWTLFGLDALPDLRQRIARHELSGSESVAAFSRLIAGLISLIFEVADATVDPDISRLLVGLFNLVEGKELAGQERAVGALAFGSGACSTDARERILHLIDAQERSFRVFLEFAEAPIASHWHAMDSLPCVSQLQRLRQLIRSAGAVSALDSNLSDTWFDCCSARISHMWSIQRELVGALQERCVALIGEAERDLLNSEGRLKSLRDNPPARAGAVDRFFDPALPVEQSLSFGPVEHGNPDRARSLMDMLQAQSQRLATMENELAFTRRALNERKVIERAKGVLMAEYRLSEDDAYRKMQTASMDRNIRLVEVAESVLALASMS